VQQPSQPGQVVAQQPGQRSTRKGRRAAGVRAAAVRLRRWRPVVHIHRPAIQTSPLLRVSGTVPSNDDTVSLLAHRLQDLRAG